MLLVRRSLAKNSSIRVDKEGGSRNTIRSTIRTIKRDRLIHHHKVPMEFLWRGKKKPYCAVMYRIERSCTHCFHARWGGNNKLRLLPQFNKGNSPPRNMIQYHQQ
eukprot:scaffold785_cov95-Cylindrotheca_fusiformis.AAC.5